MANASIGGLGSGLDTATIISQLMQLEALPKTRLQNRVTTEERQVTSLTTLNSKLVSLATQAKDLAAAKAWDNSTATSSASSVSVNAAKTADPATFTVTVDATALTHQLGFLSSAALTDVVTTGSTSVRLDRLDGTTLDLETGDGTLQGLVDAINDPAAATGLRATAVRVGDGQYRLLVESVKSGAAENFALTNTDGSALLGGATVRTARDAQVSLGAGITVTSATNTFTDLVPGVSITLAAGTAAGTTSEVAVTRDTTAVTNKVKSLVDAINVVLADVDSLTAYNATSKVAGILSGETVVRDVRDKLLNSIYPADGTSLASVGISVDRNGRLTFDATAFKEAYDADPAGVEARFTHETTDGFAERVQKLADAASNSTTGTLTAAITGRNAGISRLKDNIEQWDTRLELRRATLTRQFTALETAMNQMTSQSNWLAGQIGTLPSSSGS